MPKIDTPALLANITPSEVIGRYIELNKDGAEYSACCPFHGDSTPSFKVNDKKGFYHCFGCAAHGDPIAFVMEYRGISFREAVNEITGGQPPETYEPIAPKAPRPEEVKEWVPIMPIPEDAPPPMRTFTKKKAGVFHPAEFAGIWEYLGLNGELLHVVVRFEWDIDGKRSKEYIPQCYCRNTVTGDMKWRHISAPKPRPIYNMQELKGKPGAPVVIHEGEKKADAGMQLLHSAIHLAWAGGAKAINHTAWEILRGRKVVLWRDADQPGLEAMDGYLDKNGVHHRGLADVLRDIDCQVLIVDPPADAPEGWDLADGLAEGWTTERVASHIRTHKRAPSYYGDAAPTDRPQHDELPPPAYDDDADEVEVYRAVGYDHGRYYYLAGRAEQVMELSASSHTKLNLLSIAPLDFWENRFPAKNEVAWDMAANTLMRQCERAGVYDPSRIRGRGAWWDDEKSILHVGSNLIVNGKPSPLTSRNVKFIYEAAPPMQIDMENPLSAAEARQFVELCQMLQWEKPISAKLLAGWIFMAPICGALVWRPHIWITGGSGTGKSWVQTNIVHAVLANNAIMPQGSATEAGIRQALGQDARPVVFDEAESADEQAQKRMQGIMELSRQASSENGGSIFKGSANGKAITYRIRSMFAFSSIGVGIQQFADKTRISVLALHVDQAKSEDKRAKDFAALQLKVAELLTDDYCAKLRARAVNMIAIVRANAKTFATAGAAVIGTQRLGDQIGSMLAGVYALSSDKLITIEAARKWVEEQDWTEEASMGERKDEMACLSHILEYVVKVNSSGGQKDLNIGELISIAEGDGYETPVSKIMAGEALMRHGIKIGLDGISVANNHTALAKILASTQWAKEWGRILKRIEGAEVRKPERFGTVGGTQRCVFIPFEQIVGK